jgi:hypothetical protein
MNGHSLKLHFCMFKRSQRKHNSLDCHKVFSNIFHYLQSLHAQSLTQFFLKNCMFKAPKSQEWIVLIFSSVFFFFQMCTIPFENWRGF